MADRQFRTARALLPNAATTIYDPPADAVEALAYVHLTNPGPGDLRVTVSRGVDSATNRVVPALLLAYDSDFGGSTVRCGPFVLTGADLLQAFGDVNNQGTVHVEGVETTA